MIKFEHSVFALPFALTGALLAWRDSGFIKQGLWFKLGWIVVCMVSARSVAMAFNRVLDAEIDGRNPRHQDAAFAGGGDFRRAGLLGGLSRSGASYFYLRRGS